MDERRVIATRQVRATYRASEERIADEQVHTLSCLSCPSCLSCLSCPSFLSWPSRLLIHRETDAARTMARRVAWAGREIAKSDDLIR